MIHLQYVVILSVVLFFIGIFGCLTRRNVIGVLMSIELILNAANINLIAFDRYHITPDGVGQIFALFVIAIAAAASVVGLALVIAIYRNSQSIFMDDFHLMKW